MKNYFIARSRRVRSTPYTPRIENQGVTAYTVYNHMLLPAAFGSLEDSYNHLKEHGQVWDVSGDRQVEVSGKDSASTSAYTGGNSTGEGWYGNNPAPIIKLHDPSYTLGNAVTYKCRMKCNGNTFYLNRNQSDVSQYAVRTASTITAMEIAV